MTVNDFERRFDLGDALYTRVISTALERGGEYCDLFFQQQSSNVVALEDDEVNRAFHSVNLGVGIRVVLGDVTGYAFCEELEQESMLAAARVAAAIASGRARVPPARIEVTSAPDMYPVDRRWGDVEIDDKLPLLNKVNARAFAADARIEKVLLRFSDSASDIVIVDSDGRKVHDHRPMSSLSVSCVARDGDRREENSCSVGGRVGMDFFSEERAAEVTDRAVRRTTVLFDAVRPTAGEMPVVLAAGSSGILLHEAVGHGMEADFNRKGTSIYSDMIGRVIAPPHVSIVDDGLVPGFCGALNVDDEGNVGQRTVLVEDGVLETYLHDRISAKHYGVAPTGNGRRASFRHMPLPRMRCTYMLAGPHEKEEIIQSVKRGIYAESFSNGQVQIGAGDFTFYIKNGYLIEDGALTAPIKDVNLIGNGPEVLRDMVMVGDDLEMDRGSWACGKGGQSVPVSLGMPTVKVSKITVGGLG